MLDTLLDHNLLIQHTSGRYRLHDLVRDYARTLTTADTGESEAALGHLLDYYEHTARTLSDTPGEAFIVSDRHKGTRQSPLPRPSSRPATNASRGCAPNARTSPPPPPSRLPADGCCAPSSSPRR
jgi:hypothetical protein